MFSAYGRPLEHIATKKVKLCNNRLFLTPRFLPPGEDQITCLPFTEGLEEAGAFNNDDVNEIEFYGAYASCEEYLAKVNEGRKADQMEYTEEHFEGCWRHTDTPDGGWIVPTTTTDFYLTVKYDCNEVTDTLDKSGEIGANIGNINEHVPISTAANQPSSQTDGTLMLLVAFSVVAILVLFCCTGSV